ncbi:16S rRNA (guanine(527)-N(7))-methyltransferase RsmG [Candidatus Eisenbacteria bacterium]|uniref:Ribosomal RNA small subunit methyltransferase G n=1 Tax=Eiseniibacteriota bacterium TaxID=2212470 RepID=A0ABV6YN62_UNCEI
MHKPEDEIEVLLDLLRKSGIDPRPEAKLHLAGLSKHINHWNNMLNLVSKKDIGRLETYHFCDSASVLPLLGLQNPVRLLDVGGSNGLPGLVLAATSPHVRTHICEPRHKFEGFLEAACGSLAGEATYELDRVDSPDFLDRHRGSFDLIAARAVTRFKNLLKWCLPLLAPGGRLVAYKGSRCLEEVGQAEKYFWSHGGRHIVVAGSPWAKRCNPLRLFTIAGIGK